MEGPIKWRVMADPPVPPAQGSGTDRGRGVMSSQGAAVGLAAGGGVYLVTTPIGHWAGTRRGARRKPWRAPTCGCEDNSAPADLGPLRHHVPAQPLTTQRRRSTARLAVHDLADGRRGGARSRIAGTPIISDTGYRLVRAATEAGPAVNGRAAGRELPPSWSPDGGGPPTDRSFLERPTAAHEAARRTRIGELADSAKIVLFATAPRLDATLADPGGRARASPGLRSAGR